jgi:hypothetical protein
LFDFGGGGGGGGGEHWKSMSLHNRLHVALLFRKHRSCHPSESFKHTSQEERDNKKCFTSPLSASPFGIIISRSRSVDWAHLSMHGLHREPTSESSATVR